MIVSSSHSTKDLRKAGSRFLKNDKSKWASCKLRTKVNIHCSFKKGTVSKAASKTESSSPAWWFLLKAAKCQCRHFVLSKAGGRKVFTELTLITLPMRPWRLRPRAKPPSSTKARKRSGNQFVTRNEPPKAGCWAA